MPPDERAIRDLIAKWMQATEAGDTETVLGLMTDDVVFMVPGREPFGKEAFAAAAKDMQGARIEGTSDIRELKVLGDWAYLRSYLEGQGDAARRQLCRAQRLYADHPAEAAGRTLAAGARRQPAHRRQDIAAIARFDTCIRVFTVPAGQRAPQGLLSQDGAFSSSSPCWPAPIMPMMILAFALTVPGEIKTLAALD